jgi:hypothetical protein
LSPWDEPEEGVGGDAKSSLEVLRLLLHFLAVDCAVRGLPVANALPPMTENGKQEVGTGGEGGNSGEGG